MPRHGFYLVTHQCSRMRIQELTRLPFYIYIYAPKHGSLSAHVRYPRCEECQAKTKTPPATFDFVVELEGKEGHDDDKGARRCSCIINSVDSYRPITLVLSTRWEHSTPLWLLSMDINLNWQTGPISLASTMRPLSPSRLGFRLDSKSGSCEST